MKYDGHSRVVGRYDSFSKFSSVNGSPVASDYIKEIGPDGVSTFKKIGEFNLQDRINSHKDSCDIHQIIARYANGDLSVLSKKALDYFDTTQAPQSIADAHRYIENGEYMFNRLPVEVKEKFNFDFNQFVASIGTKEFYEALTEKKSQSDSIVKEVVAEDGKSEQ